MPLSLLLATLALLGHSPQSGDFATASRRGHESIPRLRGGQEGMDARSEARPSSPPQSETPTPAPVASMTMKQCFKEMRELLDKYDRQTKSSSDGGRVEREHIYFRSLEREGESGLEFRYTLTTVGYTLAHSSLEEGEFWKRYGFSSGGDYLPSSRDERNYLKESFSGKISDLDPADINVQEERLEGEFIKGKGSFAVACTTFDETKRLRHEGTNQFETRHMDGNLSDEHVTPIQENVNGVAFHLASRKDAERFVLLLKRAIKLAKAG